MCKQVAKTLAPGIDLKKSPDKYEEYKWIPEKC